MALRRFQKSPQLKTYPSPAAVLVASLSANLESVLKLTWSRCTTLVLLFPRSMMLLLVLKAAKMWTCPSWVLFASFSARRRRQLREPDAAGLQSCCSAMARPAEASHASNNLSSRRSRFDSAWGPWDPPVRSAMFASCSFTNPRSFLRFCALVS